MNPGGSGLAATLTILRWSLVAGPSDFEADALRRTGRVRFGPGPDPLSCVGTPASCQRPAPDELDARAEREGMQWFNTVVFLQEALRLLTRTRFSWKCTWNNCTIRSGKCQVFWPGKLVYPTQAPNKERQFIPRLKDGGFPARPSVNTAKKAP